MHAAIRRNNQLAATLYWASSVVSMVRIALYINYREQSDKLYPEATVWAFLILLVLVGAYHLLVGLGLRKGYLWLRILLLTVNILVVMVYLVSLFPGPDTLHMLKLNYDTPLEAILLSIEFLFVIGFIVVIYRGFGLEDRVGGNEYLDTPLSSNHD